MKIRTEHYLPAALGGAAGGFRLRTDDTAGFPKAFACVQTASYRVTTSQCSVLAACCSTLLSGSPLFAVQSIR